MCIYLSADQVLAMAAASAGDASGNNATADPSSSSSSSSAAASSNQQYMSMRSYIKATQGKKDELSLGGFSGPQGGQEPKIALVFAVGNIIRGSGDPSASEPQAASEKVRPSTLHPPPSTLHPPPSILHPPPSILHSPPSILHPSPSTRNPKPETRTPPPET